MEYNQNLEIHVKKLENDINFMSRYFELSKLSDSSSDLNEFISLLVKFISKQLNTNEIAFFLKQNGNYKKVFCTNTDSPEEVFFKGEEESITQLLLTSKPILTINERNENVYKKFLANWNESYFNTHIWLPFVYEEKILAIAFIGTKENSDPYSKEDLHLLEQTVSYSSNIILKLQRQKEREQNIDKLQKAIHNISILYNIGQTLNFIDDLKRLLNIILDKAITAVNAEKGSLMLYDSIEEKLSIKVVYGLPDKEIEEKINGGIIECTKIKPGEGIAGKVFATKKSIITNLGKNDPRFVHGENTNVSSILCIPLVVKGEAVGVINITNKKNGELFNQDDLEFMEALSNQAAIAIDNAQLFELATKDGLTGLYIYRHFHYLLDNEMKRAKRYNHPMSLLMLDIDNFKQINDNYGHLIGDEFLKQIGATILSNCRNIDMPGRYGGEEFAVILPETRPEGAVFMAERLRRNIQKVSVTTKSGEKISTTVSIGIAGMPDHSDNPPELIDLADIALYHAKSNGKNCISMFSKTGCEIVSPGDNNIKQPT